MILLLAFAVSGVTFTVSVTSIFSWLRELVSKIHPKFEELIFCPWCLSFWVTTVLLLFKNKDIDLLIITNNIVVNFFITVFAVMTVSGLIHFVLLRAYEPVAKAMAQRFIDKLRNKKT